MPADKLQDLPLYPELQSLSLGGNQISTVDEIQNLKKYTELVELDFLGCALTKIDDYRNKIFNEFPNLIVHFYFLIRVDIGYC